jgi:hypothetical protein
LNKKRNKKRMRKEEREKSEDNERSGSTLENIFSLERLKCFKESKDKGMDIPITKVNQAGMKSATVHPFHGAYSNTSSSSK